MRYTSRGWCFSPTTIVDKSPQMLGLLIAFILQR